MTLDQEIFDLYWHARRAFVTGDERAAEALYRRLRAEHSVELYYEVELKTPTRFVHPVGSVLGRAKYAPHLVVYQNVGVGSDLDGNRPEFSGPCVLFPGSKILGKTKIGSNVFVTANTVVQGVDVPDNSVVFTAISMSRGVAACWKPTTRSVVGQFFTSRGRRPDTSA